MMDELRAYLTEKGRTLKGKAIETKDNIKKWASDNSQAIKINAKKFIATGLTLTALLGGLAGCSTMESIDNTLDANGCTCPKCSDSYSQEHHTESTTPDFTIEETPNQTPEPPANVEVTPMDGIVAEDVLSAYDAIATEMVRHYLVETGQVSPDANVEAQFVGLSPAKMLPNTDTTNQEAKYYPFFFMNENNIYPTTLHVTASVNGQKLDTLFEFENFGVSQQDMLAIMGTNSSTLVPHLLTADELVGTDLEFNPVVQDCVNTWVHPGTSFTRESIMEADKAHLTALYNATGSMVANNMSYEIYDQEYHMN